ncbi:prostatic acid phosphatase-like [Sitodiplosis mosellana]|uniref:prostatic acid phosphatase-like n=1 Tax=Sitodiplosis mosellana TaxID=263140 RepID=UPI002445085A|nr:prostatic acid phosphatase-like [Sitodiplosis mosellana]
MKQFCVFFVLLFGIMHCGSIDLDKNNDELIFAHTLCRHGDRNPYYSFPNDIWKAEEHWLPGGYKELTNIGKRQMYVLGQYLFGRYRNLLQNGAYSPNTVYVQSTDIDRVLMSAQTCLTGMFYPSPEQMWMGSHLDWLPIPVHTQLHKEDYTLATYKRCNRFDYLMIEYLKTEEYTGLFKKYGSLFQYLEVNSGKKLPTLVDINDLYDTLSIQKLKGKQLPKWAESVMVPGGDFEYLSMFYFQIFTSTTGTKRLKSGFLLKEILDRFTKKTQSKLSPDRVLFLYFAHDNTIANMLNSLGLYKLHHITYASCLFFELYKTDTRPYVEIFYKNSSETNIPLLLEIPNCGTKCPLDKLYQLYEDILPTQSFEKECELRDGETMGRNPESGEL